MARLETNVHDTPHDDVDACDVLMPDQSKVGTVPTAENAQIVTGLGSLYVGRTMERGILEGLSPDADAVQKKQ